MTLTGPGGVGKTSLARAVVSWARADVDEAALLEFGEVTDPAQVVTSVARAFGLAEALPPVAGLAQQLRGRRTLVVLDNLEQVLECAADVAALLDACPDLRVLATGRAPLRIRVEQEVVVPPLPVPDPWSDSDVAAVAASPAVRMLVQRSTAMGNAIEIDPGTAPTLAEICRRVDGLPLALELAAAQARSVSLDTLLARLDEALAGGGPRDLPERQRSLQATLDWSHELLSEREREVFAAVGVFAEGFSLTAAEAVLDGASDTLRVLSSLVEQSLVVPVPAPGSRFRLLEPVRQYAVRRTPLSVAATHAEYFLRVAVDSRARLRGPDLVAVLDVVDAEQANIVAAHDHLLAQGRIGDAVTLVEGSALRWRSVAMPDRGGTGLPRST